MKPMKTFDPQLACRVHDELTNKLIEWKPRWAPLYLDYGVKKDEGSIAWDKFVLDGWVEAA